MQLQAQSHFSVMQATPLGRFCRLEEAAKIVLFLCSKEASYITGVVFPIDGGNSAQCIIRVYVA